MSNLIKRRTFLKASAISAVALVPASGPSLATASSASGGFTYEVTRTRAEWRALLSRSEFRILRRGGTENPNSSQYSRRMPRGTYKCKGCGLTLYESSWKVVLDIGWVFFKHSRPNAVLTSIDDNPSYDTSAMSQDAMIEAHCRRCGSHLGHIVNVRDQLLHCINGASLRFAQA